MSEKDYMEIEEELKDLPQVWIDLLNAMPDIKDEFISDKKFNRNEMISPYFFTSYFIDDYKSCEPFFLCFERGKEVFDNFYELYGDDESAEPLNETIDENELTELLIRHINGMNYLLKLYDETTYDVHEMKIEEIDGRYFEDKYDPEENTDIESCCSSSMRHNILPRQEDNPIIAFDEALYELTMNYNLIHYIMWPLGKVDDVENPYKAYVELWKRGIRPYIINKNLLVAVR